MTLNERRRALMAMANAKGFQVTKTEFTVDTDMITNGTGGNTQNFYRLYGGTERGVYIFDITENSTSSGYVQYAYHDYRTGIDRHITKRGASNDATTQVAPNYDCFIKAGSVITRFFIPMEAFA